MYPGSRVVAANDIQIMIAQQLVLLLENGFGGCDKYEGYRILTKDNDKLNIQLPIL